MQPIQEYVETNDDDEFIDAVFELAFGDSAVSKGYTHEEVLAKIKEFSDLALLSEKQD